jgi:antitoxin MazE
VSWESNYNVIMRASLIQIGNSRGIRIPKPLLEQTGLEGEVDIEVRGAQLIIRPTKHPRAGWAEAFARMPERKEDASLDRNEFEWRW